MPMSKQLKNAIAKAGAFETFAREQSKRNRIANRMQGLDERMMRQQMRRTPESVLRVNTTPARNFTSWDAARKYARAHSPYQPYRIANPQYLSPEEASAQYRQLQAQLANQDMNLADIRSSGLDNLYRNQVQYDRQLDQDLELLNPHSSRESYVNKFGPFLDDAIEKESKGLINSDVWDEAEDAARKVYPNEVAAFNRLEDIYAGLPEADNSLYWDMEQGEPVSGYLESTKGLMGPYHDYKYTRQSAYQDLLEKAKRDREAAFQRWLDMQQQPPRYR